MFYINVRTWRPNWSVGCRTGLGPVAPNINDVRELPADQVMGGYDTEFNITYPKLTLLSEFTM